LPQLSAAHAFVFCTCKRLFLNRAHRDGKVTKEQLDRLSTCEKNATEVNNGLSAKSQAALEHQTAE